MPVGESLRSRRKRRQASESGFFATAAFALNGHKKRMASKLQGLPRGYPCPRELLHSLGTGGRNSGRILNRARKSALCKDPHPSAGSGQALRSSPILGEGKKEPGFFAPQTPL